MAASHIPWSVHPATRCVVSPASDRLLERVGSLHATHGALLFRRKNIRFRNELERVPDLDTLELLACAKLEHELDHIQKFSGTSYGFLVHRLHSAQVDAFFQRIEGSSDDLHFPLFRRLPSVENSKKSERNFWAFSYLLSMLECTSGAPTVPFKWQRQLAFEAMAKIVGPVRASQPHGIVCGHPEDLAFPLLDFGGRRQIKIGGQGLLEYSAVSREATVLRYSNASERLDHSQMLSHLHVQAAKVWKVWAQLPLLQPTVSASWKSVGLTNRPQFPVESRVAADLALWPPFLPKESSEPSKWSWLDFHPGWRYLRILAHLRNSYRDFRLFMNADDVNDEWFLTLQESICDALGWPTPQWIAEQWLSYWESREANGATCSEFICDDIGRARASVELLATRLKQPFRMVLSYPGSEGRGFHWFEAVTAWQDNGELTMISPEGYEADWEELGYSLPVAFSAIKAIEIFGIGDWRHGQPAPHVRSELQVTGKGLESAITNYAKRNYGFSITFDRRPSRK